MRVLGLMLSQVQQQQPSNKFIAMNPQNTGEHVSLRHSYLWRKPMFNSKQPTALQGCHSQLNQMAQTGQSWTTRNNFIQTQSSGFQKGNSLSIKSHRQAEVDALLQQQMKYSNMKRSMLQSLRPDAKSVEKSEALVEGMKKLRQIDLLSGKDMNHVKFPGVIKIQHIYNDYHLQSANPGFSRNYLGKFYTK